MPDCRMRCCAVVCCAGLLAGVSPGTWRAPQHLLHAQHPRLWQTHGADCMLQFCDVLCCAVLCRDPGRRLSWQLASPWASALSTPLTAARSAKHAAGKTYQNQDLSKSVKAHKGPGLITVPQIISAVSAQMCPPQKSRRRSAGLWGSRWNLGIRSVHGGLGRGGFKGLGAKGLKCTLCCRVGCGVESQVLWCGVRCCGVELVVWKLNAVVV